MITRTFAIAVVSLSMFAAACADTHEDFVAVSQQGERPMKILAHRKTAKKRAKTHHRRQDVGQPSYAYPYGGDVFKGFVSDSYKLVSNVQPFDDWLREAYANSAYRLPENSDASLPEYFAWKKDKLSQISDPEQRSAKEIEYGGQIFKLVKTLIPKFSLDRGFEFTNAVAMGERQCLLQSVLVASFLQASGVDAGTVMVYLNEKSEESNNGHAVTLVKLSNGKDILVDCSDDTPYAKQHGLFVTDVTTGKYRYVKPVYDANAVIASYHPDAGDTQILDGTVRPLDVTFLRSQFEFYRGERAPGGWAYENARTPDGLRDTVSHMKASIAICPKNPLTVYLMGRCLWKLGDRDDARQAYTTALGLYRDYGYVPIGMREVIPIAGLKRRR